MDVTEIPFVKKVGITQARDGNLELAFTDETHNHLATMHASAQFTLAETASGEFLQTLFPELVGKVIPVLRDATVKFKKPAVKNIIAYPSISDGVQEKFESRFAKKGRASISVNVEIKDIENTVTCVATYNWFIQKL
ncbi:MAG: YiiD C-terminal domain-containing protein [Gammaproteobacteria bacterium]|nr:YiiD C-terminal domain-containing protein [Gammaproteobacteria bacterium]